MHRFAIVVLSLGGLGFLAFGLAFLVAPLATFALTGVSISGAVAAAEIMAFYGGLEIALGGLLLACAWSPSRRRDGLLLMGAAYACIGLARVAGMLVHGADTPFLRIALGLELGLAALALFALPALRRG
ncbi:MAG: DUF4345 domain-containing protein [Xanthomonadaceae bacterium]|jgi:hypothetical protein|nr:DUF4345 domain-containing protein [Xanthomonadaceae bacterium]